MANRARTLGIDQDGFVIRKRSSSVLEPRHAPPRGSARAGTRASASARARPTRMPVKVLWMRSASSGVVAATATRRRSTTTCTTICTSRRGHHTRTSACSGDPQAGREGARRHRAGRGASPGARQGERGRCGRRRGAPRHWWGFVRGLGFALGTLWAYGRSICDRRRSSMMRVCPRRAEWPCHRKPIRVFGHRSAHCIAGRLGPSAAPSSSALP